MLVGALNAFACAPFIARLPPCPWDGRARPLVGSLHLRPSAGKALPLNAKLFVTGTGTILDTVLGLAFMSIVYNAS